MDPQQIIKYCPKCRSELVLTDYHRFNCPVCQYVQHVSPIPCNSLLLLNDKNEIVLVERKREPKAGYWDLPGGFINLEENVEDSVIRETKEELDLNLKPADLKYFASAALRYTYKGVREYLVGMAFIARLPVDAELKAGDDAKSYKLFALDEIPWDKIAFLSATDYLQKLLKHLEKAKA